MPVTDTRYTTLYWIRRALFYYILYVIAGTQVIFILSLLDVKFTVVQGFVLLPGVFPVTLAALSIWLERRKGTPVKCRVDCKIWGILAPVMFGLWAIGYFLVGEIVDPARIRVFNSTFDMVFPFDYRWVFLYISVYPMFLLPYFYVRRSRSLITLTAGYFIMLVISYTIFVILPVAFAHRPVLEDSSDSATWAMNAVYGQDPAWNCLPSTHCGVAVLSAIAVFRDNKKLGTWVMLTALLIGISTLFTKQHYLIDVIAGYTLGGIVYWTLYRIVEPKMPKTIPMPKGSNLKDVDIS